MKNPFFSIIIPTYNRADFLKIAVDSVLNQNFNDYELIIVDDGSTDKTKDIIINIKDKRLKYIRQPHKGISVARNIGLRKAKGKFISFLDSDDRFCKNKLTITFDYIKNHPACKVFHTEEIWYRNGNLQPQKLHHKKPSGPAFKNVVKLCCIGMSTATIKKEVFNKIGGFDKKLMVCEDYDFWLRVTAKFDIFLIPYCLTLKEGGHPDQQSEKYPTMDIFRIYSLQKILESKKLTKNYQKIALDELKHKCAIYIKGALKRNKISEINKYQKIIKKVEKINV